MAKARILIVEDEKLVATDIAECLQQLGYEVVGTAASGVEALRMAVMREPDLVLMDIYLKGRVDGVAAAEALYQRMEIPIVYLTAFADVETVQRAKHTFPSGYVLKPFDDRSLRTAVELALHRHGCQRRPSKNERRLAAALTSLAEAVIVADGRGNVTLMNQAAESLTGWRQQEALGRPLAEILTMLDSESGAVMRSLVGRLALERAMVSLGAHVVLRNKSGAEKAIEGQASPLLDEEGKLAGVTVAFQEAGD